MRSAFPPRPSELSAFLAVPALLASRHLISLVEATRPKCTASLVVLSFVGSPVLRKSPMFQNPNLNCPTVLWGGGKKQTQKQAQTNKKKQIKKYIHQTVTLGPIYLYFTIRNVMLHPAHRGGIKKDTHTLLATRGKKTRWFAEPPAHAAEIA